MARIEGRHICSSLADALYVVGSAWLVDWDRPADSLRARGSASACPQGLV